MLLMITKKHAQNHDASICAKKITADNCSLVKDISTCGHLI